MNFEFRNQSDQIAIVNVRSNWRTIKTFVEKSLADFPDKKQRQNLENTMLLVSTGLYQEVERARHLKSERDNAQRLANLLFDLIPGTKFRMKSHGAKAEEWCVENNIAAKRVHVQAHETIIIENEPDALMFKLMWHASITETDFPGTSK